MNHSMTLPDKARIARAFGAAANKYDQYAHLQRDIADKLFEKLLINKTSTILDLGSGTGYCAKKLAVQFPDASVTNLDIAESMLRFAKQESENEIKNERIEVGKASWLCGDAEKLPFGEDSFDLVMSNLTIQWCENPQWVFKELYRAMKPGAHALVSTLAERTLVELKECWAGLDDYVHVNNFLPVENILQQVNSQPFSAIEHIHSQEIYFYNSLKGLTDELKGIGAHNQNVGQSNGLTGKAKLKALKQNFEKNNIQGKGIPVTYDLLILHVVK